MRKNELVTMNATVRFGIVRETSVVGIEHVRLTVDAGSRKDANEP